jgi:transposase
MSLLGYVLTPARALDVQGFGPLLRMVADRIEALLADKGQYADAIRAQIVAGGVEAVILTKSNRSIPISHDRKKYRWLGLFERMFSKLNNWRGVATRYDKTRECHLSFVALASSKKWLTFVYEVYSPALLERL